VKTIMMFSYSLRRNPCLLVGGAESAYRHFCGGECEVPGLPPEPRYVHIASLDLRDPHLAFLQIEGLAALPLVMDTARGWVHYSVTQAKGIQLHAVRQDGSEPLMLGPLPRQPLSVLPFTYEQYRAVSFASAVFDTSFLNSQDREALESLGETYSQIGGAHGFGNGMSAQCMNPDCLGFPNMSMQELASLQTQLAPGVSLDYCPNDPALYFFICGQCKSITGEVAL
jgi:hypothetical protein